MSLIVGVLPPAWEEKLRSLVHEFFPTSTWHNFRDPDKLLSFIEKAILQGEGIEVLIAYGHSGIAILAQVLAKWPHALHILLWPGDEELNFTWAQSAKIFRLAYLDKPWDIQHALHETAQHLKQKELIQEKNHVLSELHRMAMSLFAEVQVDKLVHKLLRIVLENTSADHAHLILQAEDGQLYWMGKYDKASNATNKIEKVPLAGDEFLPENLIRYVARTRENLILNNPLENELFRNLPYLRKHNVGSLMVVPLVYQGSLVGIVYLQSARASAFHADLEILKMMVAPAAIALQNAYLYSQMEELVAQRTQEVVRQKEEIQYQAQLLKRQNEDILASLLYAQRVQRAIFPSWQRLQEILPQSFLFYSPREVVSGDFYWFAVRLSKMIVAVGDCTGHGIPGAFMTVMANTLLKQIVELDGVFRPSEILYLLNLRMRAALQHEAEYQKAGEGLDLALCQIDYKRGKLLFTGANRPLVLIHKGELIEIKGDKIGIGGYQDLSDAPEYTLHTLELQKEDMLYLFSDGFADQIGADNKRYQQRHFYELLLSISSQPADRQKALLQAELQRWQGDMPQTDDITILGLRMPLFIHS
ncbi:MAG: PP2C family protein-serine/threonine phosphatase [Bacteroidia bacterium]